MQKVSQDLARVEAEKEATLVQYNQCLETISKLEERIKEVEDNAIRIQEHADIAEKEMKALKLQVTKLNEEKEDATLRYQQCLEIISSLEYKLSCAEEEVRSLNSKIVDGVEKLQSSEQQCLLLETSNHTLQSELQSLAQKMGSQSEELNEKQQELGTLWGCIQDERLRFIEAETAFQTLQQLHSQSQAELRSLDSKLTSKDEISNLRETIEKVEQEVELRIDETNALQQEIYCLKEELNDVNKKHEAIIEEVRSTDIHPQYFGSAVKKMQDENLKLKETCAADKGEKEALLLKLENKEKLLEKNTVLENSLSDFNAEQDSVRGKVNVLEETCQSLLEEKSNVAAEKATLFSQLQSTTEKLEKLSEKSNLLENSLFDVNAELEGLRVKSKVLEDTCQSLDHEKSSIFQEKETLVSQLNITHQTLKDLEELHSLLELKHLEQKGERESALQKVEELLVSLYSEREENSRVLKLNEDELAEKELQIHILQEDANCKKKEYEEELDRAIHAHVQIFILQKCVDDLEKKNFSLLVEWQRLLEASKMSYKMIYEDQTVMAPDALSYFQDMQRRINAIARTVKQLNESLKLKNEENIQASKHVTQPDQARPSIPVTEIEVLPKDIMLDQMLELWETTDKDATIGKQAEKTQKMAAGNHQRGTTKEPKNRYPSTDSLVEKELSVDKLEVSRRLTLPREEGNQSKILERLHCDAQKLTNLQITIQDLMKKVEINEKSTKGKSVEFGEVKGHQSKLIWVHLIPTYCIASKIAESTPW
ncbi:hypothetical protein JHK86_035434 [Glycine max]|nr:hypothetical protein JHK86_035434 [Glycine max]